MNKAVEVNKFVEDTKTVPNDKILTVKIEGIYGQGRDSIWFNTDTPFTMSGGSVMTDYNGYDDDEDDDGDFDDFGSQYYNMTLKGTKSQIMSFLGGDDEIIDGGEGFSISVEE